MDKNRDETKQRETVKPLMNFGIGASLPFLFAVGFGVVGLFLAIFNGSGNIIKAFKFGAGVGLFLSLYGGLEIAIGLLFGEENIINKLWRSAGFLTVWAISIYLFLNYDF